MNTNTTNKPNQVLSYLPIYYQSMPNQAKSTITLILFIPSNIQPSYIVLDLEKKFPLTCQVSSIVLGEKGAFCQIICEKDKKANLLEYFAGIPGTNITEKTDNITVVSS